MNDSEFEKPIVHQFDSFCRAAIRRGAGNAFRVAENRQKHQILCRAFLWLTKYGKAICNDIFARHIRSIFPEITKCP